MNLILKKLMKDQRQRIQVMSKTRRVKILFGKNFMKIVANFFKQEDGLTAIEYGIFGAVVLIGAIALITKLVGTS